MGSLLDDLGEDGGVDEAHEEEGLEDGVGELGRLFEKFGGFGGVGHYEAFHLGEDVEELGGREGGEGFGDGVRASEAGLEVDADGEGREASGGGLLLLMLMLRWSVAVGHGLGLREAGLRVGERCEIVGMVFGMVFGEIDADRAAHDFVSVEVANCCCGGVNVCVFAETVASGFASVCVVDEAKGDDLAG